MILTALCVIFINTPETRAATEEALSNSYVAFQAPDDASTAVQVGLSLTNALIIVSVICAMTFVIVLLYKYRCLKCLIGYMVFASAALLGFLGGSMFATAIEVYNLAVDQFSYYFTLWNFATVGTGAIFAPWGGFPTWITQGYLIATSVILAWQLSALDPWTSWALLIVLALYDLCAVLTPCGPLKALVNLMSEEGSPDMPGLLYEAELPAEARRPGRSRRSTTATAATNYGSQRSSTSATAETSQSSTVTDNNNGPRQFTATTATQPTATDNSGYSVTADTEQSAAAEEIVVNTTSNGRSAVTIATEGECGEECPDIDNVVGTLIPAIVRSPSSSPENSTSNGIEVARTATDEEAPPPSLTTADPRPGTVAARLAQSRASSDAVSDWAQVVTGTEQPRQPRPRALIPFAVAKLYKLPIESEEPERRSDFTPLLEGENLSPNELLARQYTPDQLKSLVVAIFPRNGGRIEPVGRKYMVKDRHGNLKRVLLVDDNGHVLEERRRTPEEEREEERNNNTIKLGLVSASRFDATLLPLPIALLTITWFPFLRATLSFTLCSYRKPSCTALQLL